MEIEGLVNVMPRLPLTFPSLQLLSASLRLRVILCAFVRFFVSANRLQSVLSFKLFAIGFAIISKSDFELCRVLACFSPIL